MPFFSADIMPQNGRERHDARNKAISKKPPAGFMKKSPVGRCIRRAFFNLWGQRRKNECKTEEGIENSDAYREKIS